MSCLTIGLLGVGIDADEVVVDAQRHQHTRAILVDFDDLKHLVSSRFAA